VRIRSRSRCEDGIKGRSGSRIVFFTNRSECRAKLHAVGYVAVDIGQEINVAQNMSISEHSRSLMSGDKPMLTKFDFAFGFPRSLSSVTRNGAKRVCRFVTRLTRLLYVR
jgi:hypothetical protein